MAQQQADNVRQLPGAKYCPNGNRWTNCKALMDVDEAGMRPVSCLCPYKRHPEHPDSEGNATPTDNILECIKKDGGNT